MSCSHPVNHNSCHTDIQPILWGPGSCQPLLHPITFSSSPQILDLEYVQLGRDTVVLSKLQVFRGCASAAGSRWYVLILGLGACLPAGITPRQGKRREGRAHCTTG